MTLRLAALGAILLLGLAVLITPGLLDWACVHGYGTACVWLLIVP